ncbi:S41 family peptidase [Thermoanaerobacterium sp. DL9XJH110]|uniref:S41 family peptidase n=1 Tax=Thermoanaerobacterium sp. DL9XJH110 TaxID=3386643 RepID=UPI003BB8014C
MRKRYTAFIALLLVAFLLFSPLTYRQLKAQDSTSQNIPPEINFLMQLEEFLKQNYVNDVRDLDLIKGAVKGMVESLNDPYSEYFSPEDFKNFNESTSGNFGGIGVVITSKDKYITIVSVLAGTPAEKAGLKAGDRIVGVDGKDVSNLSTAEVSNLIKGEKGTKVTLGVMREGEKQILKMDIIRDVIKVNPIEYKILGQGIGYLKISEFNENTAENIDRALDVFKKGGVQGIVLDLRDNPGGLLDQAVEVARRFVPEGPIVHVVSRDGKVQTFSSASPPSPFKLVVLVNGGTASASEVLAGAIKDRQAGILVGEKTFGKATVQRTLNLGVLGGIKLTVAHYTTPNGTDINKTGITPDIIVAADRTNPLKDFVALKGDKTLKYGSIGLEVMGIQQRLALLNLLKAEPNGIFGPRTREAVKALQKKMGLPATGVVDANFYRALDKAVGEFLNSREDVQLKKAIEVLKRKIMESQKAA